MAEHTVTVDDVRELASSLPRSYEVFVHGRVKFRVGRIVWLAFSHDRTVMGFSFPKEFRDALVESAPEKFELPRQSDLRFNWVHVRLRELDQAEMRELVVDAWSTVVPKFVAASCAVANPDRGEPGGRPAGAGSPVRPRGRAAQFRHPSALESRSMTLDVAAFVLTVLLIVLLGG